jgi:hypothetical protein
MSGGKPIPSQSWVKGDWASLRALAARWAACARAGEIAFGAVRTGILSARPTGGCWAVRLRWAGRSWTRSVRPGRALRASSGAGRGRFRSVTVCARELFPCSIAVTTSMLGAGLRCWPGTAWGTWARASFVPGFSGPRWGAFAATTAAWASRSAVAWTILPPFLLKVGAWRRCEALHGLADDSTTDESFE